MSEQTELTLHAEKQTAAPLADKLPVLTPSVDIFENESEILLHADMPGVLKDDIVINIDNGKLSLSGIRRVNMTGTATWKEFASTEFHRIFAVPPTIDVEKVHAQVKDGVLRLHLPKSEAAKPKQIEIKVG
jgi:HSP20 family molecular chaperone IbpA